MGTTRVLLVVRLPSLVVVRSTTGTPTGTVFWLVCGVWGPLPPWVVDPGHPDKVFHVQPSSYLTPFSGPRFTFPGHFPSLSEQLVTGDVSTFLFRFFYGVTTPSRRFLK